MDRNVPHVPQDSTHSEIPQSLASRTASDVVSGVEAGPRAQERSRSTTARNSASVVTHSSSAVRHRRGLGRSSLGRTANRRRAAHHGRSRAWACSRPRRFLHAHTPMLRRLRLCFPRCAGAGMAQQRPHLVLVAVEPEFSQDRDELFELQPGGLGLMERQALGRFQRRVVVQRHEASRQRGPLTTRGSSRRVSL